MNTNAESPRHRIARLLKVIVFSSLVVGLVVATGAVLKPIRGGNSFAGPWESFRSQPRDSLDVMVFGTSHAFTSIDPSEVWRTAGVPTFVLAGPTQRLQTTRYYVDEALKTQHPDVIGLEMVAFTYAPDRYDSRFHLMNVGYMPPSVNRFKAGLFATPWGERTGALVDLWAYHDRWKELTPGDYDIVEKQKGYEYLRGWIPLVGGNKKPKSVADTTPREAAEATLTPAGVHNLKALRVIARECDRRDIQLVLMLTPTSPPAGYSPALGAGYRALSAEFDNVHLLDLSQPDAVPGLSYRDDFFDGGHPSHTGAQKTSRVFAHYLVTEFNLADRRGDAAYATWNDDAKKRDAYVAEVERKARAKKK